MNRLALLTRPFRSVDAAARELSSSGTPAGVGCVALIQNHKSRWRRIGADTDKADFSGQAFEAQESGAVALVVAP